MTWHDFILEMVNIIDGFTVKEGIKKGSTKKEMEELLTIEGSD